jgi:hypothetical protein
MQMADKKKQFVNVLKDLLRARGLDSLGDQVYFPDIPEKKAANIRKKLKIPDDETILVLLDDTAFGSAKDGMVCTVKGIRYNEMGDSWAVSWKELYDNGFEDISKNDKRLIINTSDGMSSRKIDFHFYVAKINFDLLKKIVQSGSCIFGSEKDTDINTVAQLCALLNEPYQPGIENNNREDDDEDEDADDDDYGEDEDEDVDDDDYDEAEDEDEDGDDDDLENAGGSDLDITEDAEPTTVETGDPETDKPAASNQSTDLKLDKINDPVMIVCEKDDDHGPAANLLCALIKASSSIEPAIKTTVEYEAVLFEDELLDETPDRFIIFLGKAAAAISGGIAWKYNQSGIKYGWKAKKGAFLIEKEMISKNNTIGKLLKVFVNDFMANK